MALSCYLHNHFQMYFSCMKMNTNCIFVQKLFWRFEVGSLWMYVCPSCICINLPASPSSLFSPACVCVGFCHIECREIKRISKRRLGEAATEFGAPTSPPVIGHTFQRTKGVEAGTDRGEQRGGGREAEHKRVKTMVVEKNGKLTGWKGCCQVFTCSFFCYFILPNRFRCQTCFRHRSHECSVLGRTHFPTFIWCRLQ